MSCDASCAFAPLSLLSSLLSIGRFVSACALDRSSWCSSCLAFSFRLACSCSLFFFFSSRRRHTRCLSDWSSDVCSSDLPCFAPGEQAGVVFTAPAAHYPLEILRVGIAWGSQSGGAPSSLEQAIHIYGEIGRASCRERV